jgi:hypothetical protein
MAAITSLSLQAGASAHVACNVLDQNGNIMPGLQAIITDPGPDTSLALDAGMTDQGTLTGVAAGVDTLVGTYGSLTLPLPVTVAPPAPVPTSLQWTSP